MIPQEAVDAAWEAFYEGKGGMRQALEAAAPYLLAAKVAEAIANNDHIRPGGDGYSAGFHFALHCVAP